MARKVVRCDCGYVVRAENDEELFQKVQQHARAVHGMEVTREQVLSMAEPG